MLEALFERRSLENPATPINLQTLADVGGLPTNAGPVVSPLSSMRSTAVYACVRVIAETIASLPLNVYERTATGKRIADKRPEYRVLHDEPNTMMTSFIMREAMQAALLLSGDTYAEIEWSMNGQLRGLWPIHPDRVRIEVLSTGTKVYHVTDWQGNFITLQDQDILHIPGLSFDGFRGLSPIAMMRQSVGLSLAAEEFGARMFSNGMRSSAVLEHPNSLSDAAVKRLREQVATNYTGLANANKPLVLEEGMKYQQLSIAPNDAQFLETRKFQVAEIARIFRVPPHMIGDLEKATFSNIEHQSLEFVIHTIRPWLVRWEQEINRKIFPRMPFFAEFNVDGLLRGDIKSRYESYAIGRQWGWLSANDILAKENCNPIDNGDDYLMPMNFTVVGSEAAEPGEPAAAPGDANSEDPNSPNQSEPAS